MACASGQGAPPFLPPDVRSAAYHQRTLRLFLFFCQDVIHTKDMPTQHNSVVYKDHFPALDASPVMTLRASGALIFGKTHTTEFATCQKVSQPPHLSGFPGHCEFEEAPTLRAPRSVD